MATVISYQARTRRILHLVLILAAFAIGLGANVLVDLGRNEQIATSTWWQIGVLGVGALIV
ncbi:MAG: FtsW/RodA/SpoVE family cell cycle protein, partial [Dermabacter sp.]|nr:FtsW/RodA/SpoVE family cell cycle protein [Dermabacter sp.]